MTAATTRQIGMIHALKNRVGLDDETYRQMLFSMTGKRSSKELTAAQAGDVIEKLQESAGGAFAGALRAAGAVSGLSTPVARKLRALWIAGWNLGVVRDRTDRAMLGFLERQTGVSHTRFLRDPGDASKAVEGLKTWLAREAKVEWPSAASSSSAVRDAAAGRIAVIDAQWQRLFAAGAVSFEPYPRAFIAAYAEKVLGRDVRQLDALGARELDQVSAALGKKLRAALMEKKPEDAR